MKIANNRVNADPRALPFFWVAIQSIPSLKVEYQLVGGQVTQVVVE